MTDPFGQAARAHQSQLAPADNKFHVGNGDDGKHYWLTPRELYEALDAEFGFEFPYPARRLAWHHDGENDDIIAYRVVKP